MAASEQKKNRTVTRTLEVLSCRTIQRIGYTQNKRI